MRAALLGLALLLGCPAAPSEPSDPTVRYAFPLGDHAEAEPNDTLPDANAVGRVEPPLTITGASGGCGADGTWDGSDEDWLQLSPDSGAPLRFTLDMWEGDLDLSVFDATGEPVADAGEAGVDDEALELALDPEQLWFVRIRCWQGTPRALWRLRID